jgi:hypothetical protein
MINSINQNHIQNQSKWSYIIYILLFNIKDIPLGWIKILSLRVNDFKGFLGNKNIYSNKYDSQYYKESNSQEFKIFIKNYCGENPLTIFLEDLQEKNPDLTIDQLKIKYKYLNFTHGNNYLIKKEDCIKERDNIIKYLAEIKNKK